jgi:hypothetical protein
VHEACEKERLLQGWLPSKVQIIVGIWIEIGVMLSWKVTSASA